jgi:serine protease SohB
MMEILADYGIFLLQTLTIAGAVIAVIAASTRASKAEPGRGRMQVTNLSERLEKQTAAISKQIEQPTRESKGARLSRVKEWITQFGKKAADTPEHGSSDSKPVVIVLEFKGDMKASQVNGLREEVSEILRMDPKPARVILKLTSPGGLVYAYGLAGSQLARLKQHAIPLTVCVDTVAASGGYMMAVCADEIVAAPFAVLGSIGVVAQIPNINRLLKRNEVDVELHTAGAHKRTLTVLGENTPEGRKKFREDLEQTHHLFKDWIAERRPDLNLDEVADGSIYYGADALTHRLIDRIATSDDVLMEYATDHRLFELHWIEKKSFAQRLGRDTADAAMDRIEAFFTRRAEDYTRL